jgi:hypothetical protein
MSIDLKSNWIDKIKINKIYLLDSNERAVIDETFDNLHAKKKMKWSIKSISFEYLVFVIYRTVMKNDKLTRKDRVVINIRDLNAIIVSDVYLMLVQTNIIVAVAECEYISIMNVLEYFYQWIVKLDDRHKLIVIFHREQKQFNVCVMNYKNFSIYVQRQTNLMLKDLRSFVRVYMNDIIVFSKTLNDHLRHLRSVFQRLWHYNVALNSKKTFLEYSSIVLLEQIMNALELTTVDEKLAAIINLAFSFTLKKLEKYLNLTEYLRVYVSWYAQTFLSLQNRKILLLKQASVKDKSRKVFVKKILLNDSTQAEVQFYEHLQAIFSKKSFLRHCSELRKLFIDVNISKNKDVEVMIFHVKKDSKKDIIFTRDEIESIMFLSKILISIETRYWSIELEMIDVIWVTKKVRHLIESSRKSFTIIFTNHFALTVIAKQTSLTTANTNKLNLRLMKASQYLSALSIEIRVKSEKFHIILDALSRLFFIMNKDELKKKDEILENLKYDLNSLLMHSISELRTFVFDVCSTHVSEYLDIYFEQEEFMIEMMNEYRRLFINVYKTDEQWSKLNQKLQARQNIKNTSDVIEFISRNDLTYYVSEDKISRLCISWFMKKDIYQMTHDDNHHCEFHRAYARIAESLYIRHMNKRLRRYIQHCRICLEEQIMRHSSHEELNSIRIMTFSFHTIIIDFVMILSIVSIEKNAFLITTDKFFKRISMISEKDTWNALDWARAWLNALQREEWRIFRVIISNRDSKFLKVFWIIIFQHMRVKLHFITAYHSSTNDQFERTNQTIEIVIRFTLMKDQKTNFIKIISFIQSFMNNSSNTFTKLSFNEILYDFKVAKSLNLLNDCNSFTKLKEKRKMFRSEVEQAIIFANASMKIRHDRKKKSLNLKLDDLIYVKFHKDYTQSDLINRKFSKQRLRSVKILKKIEKLVYRLKISSIWKIHSIVFAIHLESASTEKDSYQRKKRESDSIEDATEQNDIYEIERILTKRSIKLERTRTLKIQYRIKWKEWDDQHNQWINAKDMINVKNIMNEFEFRLKEKNI